MIIDQIENILAKYGYPISNVNWVYFWFGRQGYPLLLQRSWDLLDDQIYNIRDISC